MGKYEESERRKRAEEHIQRAHESANQSVVAADLANRRREAMKDHPDYQRKQRLGQDGRTREAVENLARNIHKRNELSGDPCPSYTKAQEAAARSAERVNRKG